MNKEKFVSTKSVKIQDGAFFDGEKIEKRKSIPMI